MVATKILQQIDKNFDSFKHLACEYNCLDLNRIRNCKNTNPVTRYICYKIYSRIKVHILLLLYKYVY